MGALSLLSGHVYVPFGGYDGDCGAYHGVVANVVTGSAPKVGSELETGAQKGGVWAPGGVVSDGASIFFSSGNTFNAATYAGGEAMVRSDKQLTPLTPKSTSSYFSPVNWQTLDNDDYDLGGVAPTLIDLPGSTPSKLAMALGKDGNAYLTNAADLGGISNALQKVAVNGLYTHTATARYPVGSAFMVAFNSQKPFCSSSEEGIDVLTVSPGAPPTVANTWCTPIEGRGDPIVTTSNGVSDPIVWATGAEGDEELHAFDGVTGALLYSSAASTSEIRHFTTLLVADQKIFVTSDNKVTAYTLP